MYESTIDSERANKAESTNRLERQPLKWRVPMAMSDERGLFTKRPGQ